MLNTEISDILDLFLMIVIIILDEIEYDECYNI
jgi:hypothetical protein